MIEAELKARLVNIDRIRPALDALATGVEETYEDRYLDTPGEALDASGRELRVRTISRTGQQRHLLTYKGRAVDEESGSKPEWETEVADPSAVCAVLAGLGYHPVLEFTKNCVNYRFTRDGREFLATLARVTELDADFLEVETQALEDEVGHALAAVRLVMSSLGVDSTELTTESYTGAVRRARR
jgi:adenylate cyclase class 2